MPPGTSAGHLALLVKAMAGAGALSSSMTATHSKRRDIKRRTMGLPPESQTYPFQSTTKQATSKSA